MKGWSHLLCHNQSFEINIFSIWKLCILRTYSGKWQHKSSRNTMDADKRVHSTVFFFRLTRKKWPPSGDDWREGKWHKTQQSGWTFAQSLAPVVSVATPRYLTMAPVPTEVPEFCSDQGPWGHSPLYARHTNPPYLHPFQDPQWVPQTADST